MPKIKIVSGKVLIKFLIKNGFKELRQKGSHKEKDLLTVISIHGNKDLGQGLICDILKQSGIDVDFYNQNI